MSTQPSSVETTIPTPFTTEDTEEHREELKSLLDEPWKVTILPDPPKLPPGVLPAPDPHAAKSLPWRRGDVTRLKDDSPKGMMEYIAMHTSGWWQELAERALRDNDKAERMAREAGWQPGQYWSLEVDAEAKQKLLEAEEAKRQREEAERAKEQAEKEAFMQRQVELLKKAGKAPRCEYVYTDGRGCRAPQVKGERWCHGHVRMMSYRPEKLELEPMEDEQAVMVNLYRVTRSLLAGRISEKVAGLTLWSIAIGMPVASRVRKTYHGGTETRRKARRSLPRIHADERGSERKQAKAKPKTFETRRNGGTGRKTAENRPQMNTGERRSEKKVSKHKTHRGGAETRRKSSPLINTDGIDKPKGHAGTPPRSAKIGPSGDPGVTRRKSFRSGVTGGGTPPHPRGQTASDRVNGPSASGLSVSRREVSRGLATCDLAASRAVISPPCELSSK
jgi:hypothetical protein